MFLVDSFPISDHKTLDNSIEFHCFSSFGKKESHRAVDAGGFFLAGIVPLKT
jgi:hypothetical protein